MKRHLFLSTVAAACLLLPAAALADPPQDRGQGQDKKDQPHQKGPDAGKGKPAAAAQPERGASKAGAGQQGGGRQSQTPQSQTRESQTRESQTRESQARQPQAQVATPAPQHTRQAPAARTEQPTQRRVERAPEASSTQHAGPTAPSFQREPGVRAGQQQTQPGVRSGQQPQDRNQAVARQAPPSLGQWHAPASRPERSQAGQQWRQQHQNWDQSAAWRRSPDWWRGDSSFRLFSGLRMGFFFVPDRGYIALPHQYRDRHWEAGDYLPAWFRTYTVNDYARYGLPPPPYGCVWVWLNGDVALIDPSDGYVLDIARNVW